EAARCDRDRDPRPASAQGVGVRWHDVRSHRRGGVARIERRSDRQDHGPARAARGRDDLVGAPSGGAQVIRVLTIIGSTRENRYADKAAAWIHGRLSANPDITAELADLRDYPLPM